MYGSNKDKVRRAGFASPARCEEKLFPEHFTAAEVPDSLCFFTFFSVFIPLASFPLRERFVLSVVHRRHEQTGPNRRHDCSRMTFPVNALSLMRVFGFGVQQRGWDDNVKLEGLVRPGGEPGGGGDRNVQERRGGMGAGAGAGRGARGARGRCADGEILLRGIYRVISRQWRAFNERSMLLPSESQGTFRQ